MYLPDYICSLPLLCDDILNGRCRKQKEWKKVP